MIQKPDPQTAEPGPEPAAGAGPLPYERDEQAVAPKQDGQHRHNRKPIAQAHQDVESGIKDTERIGTPNDVPSSADQADER